MSRPHPAHTQLPGEMSCNSALYALTSPGKHQCRPPALRACSDVPTSHPFSSLITPHPCTAQPTTIRRSLGHPTAYEHTPHGPHEVCLTCTAAGPGATHQEAGRGTLPLLCKQPPCPGGRKEVTLGGLTGEEVREKTETNQQSPCCGFDCLRQRGRTE